MTHSRGPFISWLWKHLRPVLTHLPCGRSHPPIGQEELEFAIMRIEALKLARQIALASRSRQDTKVLGAATMQCLSRMSCGPQASLTIGQAGNVGAQPSIIFQKAKSGTFA